jgi:putative methyltransferase (TIGR04325 family)
VGNRLLPPLFTQPHRRSDLNDRQHDQALSIYVMKLTDFVPPIFTRAVKQVFLPGIKYRAFPSYTTAAAATPDGYEQEAVLDVVVRKTNRLLKELREQGCKRAISVQMAQNTLALLLTAQAEQRNSSPLTVLEVGGACGATCSELQTHLPNLFTRWSIVETPAMVEMARKNGFETPILEFFSDIHQAIESTRPTVLFLQAVLQYVPSPLLFFEDLLSRNVPWIYLSRNVFHPTASKEIVILHSKSLSSHGPCTLPEPIPSTSVTVPLTLIPLHPLKELIHAQGYEIARTFDEPYSHTFYIDGVIHTTQSQGLLLKKL